MQLVVTIRLIRLICFLCVIIIAAPTYGQLYASAEPPLAKKITAPEKASASCPPAASLGNMNITPPKPEYCPGDDISFFFSTTYPTTGPLTWRYSGSYGSDTPSGPDNIQDDFFGIQTTGNVITIGAVMVGASTCTFSISNLITVFAANAGPNTVFMPGYSTSPLGIAPPGCEINGTAPYTESWSPTVSLVGSTNNCQATIDGQVSNTIYTLNVSDSYCSASDTVLVKLVCPPANSFGSISASPSKTLYCKNANVSGSVTIINTYFGFNGNVTWSFNGIPAVVASGSLNSHYSITGLATNGTLTASGKVKLLAGSMNCSYTSSLAINIDKLQANAGSDLSYTPGVSPSLTLGVSSCASNGSPAYTQSWTPATFFTSANNICQPTVNTLTSNIIYDLTVSDNASCSATDQMNVTLACPTPSSIASVVPVHNIQCMNSNSSGSLSVLNSAFGVTGNVSWSYTGSPSITTAGTHLTNYTITNLSSAGTLTASGIVQLSGGTFTCPFTAQKTLSMTSLAANAGPDKVYVPGAVAINIGTSSCASGSSSYTYSWTSSGTGLTGPTNSCIAQVVNISTNTTYDLSVHDASCTAVDQMSVTLACPASSSIAAIVSSQSVHCLNGNITGSLSVLNPAFSLSNNATWNFSGTPSVSGSGTNLLNFAINGFLTAGTLSVSGSVVVNGGTLVCPYTAQTSFSPFVTSLAADAGLDVVYIPGTGPATIGSMGCAINGSPGPGYNYSWTPSTGTLAPVNACTFQVNNLHTNIVYTLTVYDSNCNASDAMTVTLACPSAASMGAAISLSTVQPVYCHGATVSGSVNSGTIFSVISPVNWSYSGSNSVTTSGTNSINFSITGLQSPGVVTASGTMQINSGTLNCPFTATTAISQSSLTAAAGAPQAWSSGGITAVLGNSVCGAGTGYTYTVSWTPTTGLSSGSICNPTITNLSGNTTYTLTVTDTYCTASSTVAAVLLGAVSNNKNYAILKRKLDAGYVNSVVSNSTNILYFKFDEEYYAPPNTSLNYKLYNDSGTAVTVPYLPETIGDNRYALSVFGIGSGFYRLCVYNQKHELWQSRIKIN